MYPTGVRRILVALGLVLAGLVVACWHRRGGTGLDHWVAARLSGLGGWSLTAWLHRVTDPWFMVGGAGVLAFFQERVGRRRRAVALVVPVLAALAVTELVLKPGVDARSVSGTSTFPSGNVTGGVALVATVYRVEVRRRLRTRRRTAAFVALTVVVALSCVSLVADRTHYLTDAVGGVCVGVGVPLGLLGRRRAPARRQEETVDVS